MFSSHYQDHFKYDDAYETCLNTHATLWIFLPDDADPQQVTELLGVQPSYTQRYGEMRQKHVMKRPTAWSLESRGRVESKDFRRHIDWLLDQVCDKREVLQVLQAKGCMLYIACFWVSRFGHGGPMLDVTSLSRLADLKIAIDFDVNFNDDPIEKFVHHGTGAVQIYPPEAPKNTASDANRGG